MLRRMGETYWAEDGLRLRPVGLNRGIGLPNCRRLSCVLGMFSSLEVKVLRPT